MLSFEVRVPAHERPEMLRRALQSLYAQTYPHWRAVIHDDSRSSCVREAVESLGSTKIRYEHNPTQLGAAQNIDQCFTPVPESNGRYGCVLEDDNYWLPKFLEAVACAIGNKDWGLIMANQRVHEQGKGLRPSTETTRGPWFQQGAVEPLELRASLLFMEGLSNGGLIWKLNDEIDLRVGQTVNETGLHEACRSLLIDGPFLFLREANAVWSLMSKSQSARLHETNRTISRGMQSIRTFVLAAHGQQVVKIARAWAEKLHLANPLVQALCYAGHPSLAQDLLQGRRKLAVKSLAKGMAIRSFVPDPCGAFLGSPRIGVL